MNDYSKSDMVCKSDGACIPKQESEVFSKLDDIAEALSYTDELLSILERRLNPILQSCPEECDDNRLGGLTVYKTKLSGSLGDVYSKVMERNNRLETIISNIVI